MRKKHKIIINVSDDGKKTNVMTGATMRLPQRFVKWLFGDFSEVYLLSPGKTVSDVEVREVNE